MSLRYVITSGTNYTTTFTTCTMPPLTPYEHNVLLQYAGYPLTITWDMDCMNACNRLLSRGHMTGVAGSPYPRDYRITQAGHAALQLRLDDAR